MWFYAQEHHCINTAKLLSVVFHSTDLASVLGTHHDFAMYFDFRYKEAMLGAPKSRLTGGTAQPGVMYPVYYTRWDACDVPAYVYTNYDFYIKISVKSGSFHEFTTSNAQWPQQNVGHIHAVPLSGECTREQLTVTFVSLAPAKNPALQTLVDPTSAQLAQFLAQRKPYIHPVIVMDFLRERSLEEVTAFFGEVAQSELNDARDKLAQANAAQTRVNGELQGARLAAREEQARQAVERTRMQELEREVQQQRTKLNAAALRIKKLEMKLAQSEKMYEDLQMRIIEQEGLDGDDFNGDVADDATLDTAPL
jgi:hypothetical protein